MLQRIQITPKSMNMLLEGLGHTSLRSLTLNDVGLTKAHLTAFKSLTSTNKKLNALYLNHNPLTMDACLPLAQGLVLAPRLKTL
jgi:hypothetical protein